MSALPVVRIEIGIEPLADDDVDDEVGRSYTTFLEREGAGRGSRCWRNEAQGYEGTSSGGVRETPVEG